MPIGARCECRSLLLQGRTHSSAAQGSQIELIIVSLLAPGFSSESCLIQDEPGGRDGFSYKMSLEKRFDALGRDQNGDRWHRSACADSERKLTSGRKVPIRGTCQEFTGASSGGRYRYYCRSPRNACPSGSR